MSDKTNINQRVMLSKRLIKEALISMLKTQNINKISIRELCQIAGINRTTFYNHYGSQYDVLNEIADEFLQKTSYTVMKDLAEGRSFTDSLIDVLTYIKENMEFAKLILQQDNYDIVSHLTVSVPQFDTMFLEKMPDNLSQEQKQAIVTFVQYGAVRLLIDWIQSDCNQSPKVEADLLLFVIGKIL